jgi:hypothetical protein
MNQSQPQSDPLGVYELTETIRQYAGKIDELKALVSSGLDMPITEAVLIEKTGLSANTLAAMRKEGALRFYKARKHVTYIPSEFTEDIRKLAIKFEKGRRNGRKA